MTTIRLHYNVAGHVAAAQVDDGPVRELRRWRSSFGPFESFVELAFLDGPEQVERFDNPTIERVGGRVSAPAPGPRDVLAAALTALDWARDWRAEAMAHGPAEDAPGGEHWAYYRAGSTAAAAHDRRCVEEQLRKVLGLEPLEVEVSDAG